MLILASLSGIQDFLFDVRESGGKQARSLRNRSFRIQLVAECVALRLLDAAELTHDKHLLFSAAGKVCIHADQLSNEAVEAISRTAAEIERQLLDDTHGRLRLAVTVEQSGQGYAVWFERAHQSLGINKLRPFARRARGGGSGTWGNDALVVRAVWDADAEADRDARVGRDLVSARWLTIRRANGQQSGDGKGAGSAELDTLGYMVRLERAEPTASPDLVSCSNLVTPESAPHSIDHRFFHPRRLARRVPRDERGDAIEFVELAARSRGAPMLGVLKADADSLGAAVSATLRSANGNGAASLRTLSQALDRFFAETLENQQQRQPWNLIYTVFSGGDDLLAVGPWNIMLDFAGHVQTLFNNRFGQGSANPPSLTPLTISAGVAIIKPKYPIHLAAAHAEELLEIAKGENAPRAGQPKDQCAALGSLWKWADHDAIIGAGKQLAEWVDAGIIQRGWLHTLLELALLRRGEANPEYGGVHPAVATSRLAYHVARNWPRMWNQPRDDRQHAQNNARTWIDAVLREFDQFDTTTHVETIHLPAIVRYAMLATRSGGSEDRT